MRRWNYDGIEGLLPAAWVRHSFSVCEVAFVLSMLTSLAGLPEVLEVRPPVDMEANG